MSQQRTVILTENTRTMNWTRKKLEQFKIAHASAISETFEFEGKTFFRPYASYLIFYLENKFK